MDACLRQVAYDARSGFFDIDKITTSIGGKVHRDLIHEIKAVIGTDTLKHEIVVEAVAKMGYRPEEVETMIDALLRSGDLMSPRTGLLKVV